VVDKQIPLESDFHASSPCVDRKLLYCRVKRGDFSAYAVQAMLPKLTPQGGALGRLPAPLEGLTRKNFFVTIFL
jgi:hypothetical protein